MIPKLFHHLITAFLSRDTSTKGHVDANAETLGSKESEPAIEDPADHLSFKKSSLSSPRNRCLQSINADWFQAWGATTEKPNNDVLVAENGSFVPRTNEDRFRLDRTETGDFLAGVADGAGGDGLYCGHWANKLLTRLPSRPIETGTELNKWIDSFWEEFRNEFKERARADPLLYRKFIKEGSFATLSAVWLRRVGDRVKFSALLYGDSPLFLCRVVNDAPMLQLLHPENVAAFLHDPSLLSLQCAAAPEGLRILTDFEVVPGDALIIASDGIGQYLLLRGLYGGPDSDNSIFPNELFQEIEMVRAAGETKLGNWADAHQQNRNVAFYDEFDVIRRGFPNIKAFVDFVGERFKLGLIPNDDCTMVVINIGAGKLRS